MLIKSSSLARFSVCTRVEVLKGNSAWFSITPTAPAAFKDSGRILARELDLMSIVCSDSMYEMQAVAQLHPDMMIAEPAELIGTGEAADLSYVSKACETIAQIDPDIGILVGGGISSGDDVYRIIMNGADATGSSSGIVKAGDPGAMIDEMLSALRAAWDERHGFRGNRYA